MAKVKLTNVTLKFPITYQEKSLRTELFNRLLKKKQEFHFSSGIENISLDFSDGDRVGLLGLNGSGKTTLLKIISEIYKPNEGNVVVEGRLFAMISMDTGLDMESNGIENIYNISYMRGIKKKEIEEKIDEIIEFSGLGTSIYKPLRTYSSGMVSRLSASLILNIDCDILLLDEFISTGDKNFREKIGNKVMEKIKNSSIFIFASHDEELVNRICNKKIVLEKGKIVEFVE